jgi:hypothetical protein
MGCITSRRDTMSRNESLEGAAGTVSAWGRGTPKARLFVPELGAWTVPDHIEPDRWVKWAPVYDELELDEMLLVGISIREGW